jgi:hypothetical protein
MFKHNCCLKLLYKSPNHYTTHRLLIKVDCLRTDQSAFFVSLVLLLATAKILAVKAG